MPPLQVRLDVLEVFGLARVDVARQVQVEVVLGRSISPTAPCASSAAARAGGEGVDDAVDVLRAQPVLVAVLDEALAGVDHEDALAARRLLVQHHDAGRDAGAVEQVGRQADDALDVPCARRASCGWSPRRRRGTARRAAGSPRPAGALQAGQDVQQEGVVAVLRRRHAESCGLVPKRPYRSLAGSGRWSSSSRERRVGDHEVEGLEPARCARP
jgi:hypothetical protein